jgi:hypothetical protein
MSRLLIRRASMLSIDVDGEIQAREDQERRAVPAFEIPIRRKQLEFYYPRVQHSIGIKRKLRVSSPFATTPEYKQRQIEEVQFDLPLYTCLHHHQCVDLGTPVTVISFQYSFVVIAGTFRAHFANPGFFTLVLERRYPGIYRSQASRETLPKARSGACPSFTTNH